MDDGATSSWLGPLLVGVQRRADGLIKVARIEPELLLTPSCWRRLVSGAARRLLHEMGATPGRRVLLCRGTLLDRAARDLTARGYRIERGVITGGLQAQLGLEGRTYLRSLEGLKTGQVPDQLSWVAADPDQRLHYMRAQFRDRLRAQLEAAAASECAAAGG